MTALGHGGPSGWPGIDDIDDALAADFDGSLSGLGIELGTASFNMSETLLALPSIKGSAGATPHIPLHVASGASGAAFPSHGIHHSLGTHVQHQQHQIFMAHQMAQSRIKKNRPLQVEEETAPTTIKRFCNDPGNASLQSQLTHATDGNSTTTDSVSGNNATAQQKHSTSAPDLRHCATAPLDVSGKKVLVLQTPVPGPSNTSVATGAANVSLSSGSSSTTKTTTLNASVLCSHANINDKTNVMSFQCVLGAATSIATKLNERTMTYLNQGQSYEIKLKKLGDVTEMQGKLLRSVVRVGFQERRLQFIEREQMEQWAVMHPLERILDVDIPLSYGVFDVVCYPKLINSFEFVWDPTKETGVFVRLNCISTEFTPKKHGGEKGVPFCLTVETYTATAVHPDPASCADTHNNPSDTTTDEGTNVQLYSASCQVKVFKPKGADRKHKTDREKMSKRPLSEQELYQPSFDCTFFTDCPLQLPQTPSRSHHHQQVTLRQSQRQCTGDTGSDSKCFSTSNISISADCVSSAVATEADCIAEGSTTTIGSCAAASGSNRNELGDVSPTRCAVPVTEAEAASQATSLSFRAQKSLSPPPPPSSPNASSCDTTKVEHSASPNLAGALTVTTGSAVSSTTRQLRFSASPSTSLGGSDSDETTAANGTTSTLSSGSGSATASPVVKGIKKVSLAGLSLTSTSPAIVPSTIQNRAIALAQTSLASDASPLETSEWLRANRFSLSAIDQLTTGGFSGGDLLRLTKPDLIAICGIAEGIRMYNLLHARAIPPALTLYVGTSLSTPFIPLFLEKATSAQLRAAISTALGLVPNVCKKLYLKGPAGIRVLVTDDLVCNLSDETAYLVDATSQTDHGVLLMTCAKAAAAAASCADTTTSEEKQIAALSVAVPVPSAQIELEVETVTAKNSDNVEDTSASTAVSSSVPNANGAAAQASSEMTKSTVQAVD